MAINHLTLGCTVTFMKYRASVISLIFLQKTLTWSETTFPADGKLAYEEYL